MTFQGDPYRTLGIAPGASLNEIRSAYRRLAKQFHPDAAGERALPRFLAIQAAYERLVDGEGRLRPPDAGPAGSRPPGAPGEPWRADTGRARASRDAWRARRSGSGGTAASPSRSSSGPKGRGGGTRPPGSEPGGDRPHARRGPRKATPGSTSYDEASETPLDPAWEGGAWYGPSSGTYWTINPREYADPRKHGPEYLARARRAAGEAPGREAPGWEPADQAPGQGAPGREAAAREAPGREPPGHAAADPAPASSAGAEDGSGDWAWTGAGPTTTDGGAGSWGSRAWTYDTRDPGPAWTPGPEPRPRRGDGGPAGGRPRTASTGPEPSALPDLEALARLAFPEHLLALATGGDRRWRLLLALVAWPPIGYGLGGLVSATTGCARFSAACPEPVPVLLVLVQPFLVALLFALPPLTAVAAFASLAALAMALPVGAVLSVGALPRPAVEPTVLGVIVATTYAIALGAAVVRLWARPPPGDRAP